ncbi:MAG: hypothetical protein IJV27_07275 [Prevotella sp.]|nr:hypothetical protein [Prevotella sp.]
MHNRLRLTVKRENGANEAANGRLDDEAAEAGGEKGCRRARGSSRFVEKKRAIRRKRVVDSLAYAYLCTAQYKIVAIPNGLNRARNVWGLQRRNDIPALPNESDDNGMKRRL